MGYQAVVLIEGFAFCCFQEHIVFSCFFANEGCLGSYTAATGNRGGVV